VLNLTLRRAVCVVVGANGGDQTYWKNTKLIPGYCTNCSILTKTNSATRHRFYEPSSADNTMNDVGYAWPNFRRTERMEVLSMLLPRHGIL